MHQIDQAYNTRHGPADRVAISVISKAETTSSLTVLDYFSATQRGCVGTPVHERIPECYNDRNCGIN